MFVRGGGVYPARMREGKAVRCPTSLSLVPRLDPPSLRVGSGDETRRHSIILRMSTRHFDFDWNDNDFSRCIWLCSSAVVALHGAPTGEQCGGVRQQDFVFCFEILRRVDSGISMPWQQRFSLARA